MNHIASRAMFLLLAILAGLAWSLVYPLPVGSADDVIALLLGIFFFAAFQFTRGSVRSLFVLVAVASAIGGLVTLAWSAASWRLGFWYPSLPPFLRSLFQADGETSYNVADGELFVVLFLVLLTVLLVFAKLRQFRRSG